MQLRLCRVLVRLSLATDDIPQCPKGTPVEECVHTLTGEFLVRDSMHKCSSKSDAFCSPGWNETSDVELLRAGTHCHARTYKCPQKKKKKVLMPALRSLKLHSGAVCEQRRVSTRRSTIWTLAKSSVTMSLCMVKGSSRPAASILTKLAMLWASLLACKFSSLVSVVTTLR